eukprot:g15408.t1
MSCFSDESTTKCDKKYSNIHFTSPLVQCNATLPYDGADICEWVEKFENCALQDCDLSLRPQLCSNLASALESKWNNYHRYHFDCIDNELKCSLRDGCLKACQNSDVVKSVDGSYPPCDTSDPCLPLITDDPEKYAKCQAKNAIDGEIQKIDQEYRDDNASQVYVKIIAFVLATIVGCLIRRYCCKKKKTRRKSQIGLPQANSLTQSNVPYTSIDNSLESATETLEEPLVASHGDKKSKSEKSQSLEQLIRLKEQGVLSDEDVSKARKKLEKM